MDHNFIKIFNDLDSLTASQRALFALFDRLGIATTTYEHPPVFTVEEGEALGLDDHIPGQSGKSLLLTNKAGNLWLVVACDHTRADLKALARHLGSGRLSFARPEVMQEVMAVTPGSATPFAVMHDTEKRLKIMIDRDFTLATHCVFHPLQNTYSTVMEFNDLLRFLTYHGYQPEILALAQQAAP